MTLNSRRFELPMQQAVDLIQAESRQVAEEEHPVPHHHVFLSEGELTLLLALTRRQMQIEGRRSRSQLALTELEDALDEALEELEAAKPQVQEELLPAPCPSLTSSVAQ